MLSYLLASLCSCADSSFLRMGEVSLAAWHRSPESEALKWELYSELSPLASCPRCCLRNHYLCSGLLIFEKWPIVNC